MQALKPRSRMVSFRVSQEEYDNLLRTSLSKGARSVSDFTRSMACKSNQADLEEYFLRLEEALKALSEAMKKLDSSARRLVEISEARSSKASEL